MPNSFDVNTVIVDENSTIKNAMKVIDKGLIGLAFVVTDEKQLFGVVTDGDIRRALLEGISLNEKISKIINKDPFVFEDGQPHLLGFSLLFPDY